MGTGLGHPCGYVGPLHPGPGKFPTVVLVDSAPAFTLGESEHQRTSQNAGRRLPGWFFPTQACSGFDSALSGLYQELVFLEGLEQPAPALAWGVSCGGMGWGGEHGPVLRVV